MNLERVEAMQYLVGFKNGSSPPVLCEESMKSFENYTSLFGSMGNDDMYSVGFDKAYLDHVQTGFLLISLFYLFSLSSL